MEAWRQWLLGRRNACLTKTKTNRLDYDRPSHGSDITTVRCAVKSASPQRVRVPPGSWFAPPGSNQSGDRGDEVVGASGVEGRLGDLASMQAVTRVNAEQAPKRAT